MRVSLSGIATHIARPQSPPECDASARDGGKHSPAGIVPERGSGGLYGASMPRVRGRFSWQLHAWRRFGATTVCCVVCLGA